MNIEKIKKYKQDFLHWLYDVKDSMKEKGGLTEIIITFIISLLIFPFVLVYYLIIKPIFNSILTLIDMRKIGLKKAFRKHFYDEDGKYDYEAEKELEKRLTLDHELHKTFHAKDLWPDAVVKDGMALYGVEGRTLLYVHEDVEEFEIPDGVVNVYHKCFHLCTKLKKVTFPSTIQRIGNQAFSGCISLREMAIPESVISIGDAVFKNCVALESVTLPSMMIEITENMFENCRSLKTLTLPKEIIMICKKAFKHCISLEHIELNDKLEMIREKAFEDCWSLKELIMPDSVRFIEEGTLNNCYALEKLHISKIMKNFGGSCCENCWSLREVTMTKDDNFIAWRHKDWEEHAKTVKPEDSECPYPENIYWSDGKAVYVNIPRLSNVVLVLCLSKEEEFTIPDFVAEVKQFAFTTCKKLHRLRLSPRLHPKARNWSEMSYINHEFIYECWPQVDEIFFDKSLDHKPFDMHYI
ncbi:MAG: leucine-rich repeat domain-containing protein [Prevotella sp.]|nr:leucine-rich repeat domain-containing protein [Prevotella sp.]